MYLRIRHATTYRYAQPVSFGPHRLMLRPRDSFDLRVIDTAITISPQASLRWMHDAYGNPVAMATFAGSSDTLDVVSELVIQRFGSALPRTRVDADVESSEISYTPAERAVLQPYLDLAAADPGGRSTSGCRTSGRGRTAAICCGAGARDQHRPDLCGPL
jgi:transglutaminase-like putative cysteine protease